MTQTDKISLVNISRHRHKLGRFLLSPGPICQATSLHLSQKVDLSVKQNGKRMNLIRTDLSFKKNI